MIRQLHRTLSLIAMAIIASGTIETSAQIKGSSPYGEATKESSYSALMEQKKANEFITQELRDETRPIYATTEGFYVRFVDEEAKTVEIAPAQTAEDRLRPGIYFKEVVIPETLNVKVKEVTVACTVVAIGKAAFGFDEVYSIKYPQTCKEIKDRAFWITPLTECVLPDHIEVIGDDVFRFCKAAKKIEVGKGLKTIGKTPFADCLNVSSIKVSPENPILSSEDDILYDKEKTKVLLCASERKEVHTVTLPATVKMIDDYAFTSCVYLKHINLNEGLEHIGHESFYNCSWLEELVIPSTVKSIEPGAFAKLKKCETVKVAAGNDTFEAKSDGKNEGKLLINKKTNTLHTCLYKGTTEVTVPDGIVAIAPQAFLACGWTSSIKFPSSLERLGRACFSEMYSLTEFEFPEKVTEIPPFCISECKKLETITLGKNVTLVGYKAFDGNETMIEKGGTLRILATTPPALGKDDDNKFYDLKDIAKKVVLRVPDESIPAYKKARGWSKFRKIISLANDKVQTLPTLQLSVYEGTLYIVAQETAPISIHTIDGATIYSTTALESQITLPRGVYVVTYGNQAHKVQVY